MNSPEPMHDAFSTLEPKAETVERIAPAVMTAWQARPRALWREWLDMLRAAPLRHGAWAAAACMVLLLTPVGSALSTVLAFARPSQSTPQASGPPKKSDGALLAQRIIKSFLERAPQAHHEPVASLVKRHGQ